MAEKVPTPVFEDALPKIDRSVSRLQIFMQHRTLGIAARELQLLIGYMWQAAPQEMAEAARATAETSARLRSGFCTSPECGNEADGAYCSACWHAIDAEAREALDEVLVPPALPVAK